MAGIVENVIRAERMIWAAMVGMALAATAADAQQRADPDAAAGQTAARHQCAFCHDVTGKTPPDHPPGGAPAFLEIAQSPKATPEHLRQFLLFPHGRMVNFLLTGREADNVVAYILSLRN